MTQGIPRDGWTPEKLAERGKRVSEAWAKRRALGIKRGKGKWCKKARERHAARMKAYWKGRGCGSRSVNRQERPVNKPIHIAERVYNFCPSCGCCLRGE